MTLSNESGPWEDARTKELGLKRFIAIAGNIGAGKTTLVEFLQRTYGFEPVYEPYLDNPYLDDFYADMARYAFHSQLYFLTHKFRLHLGLNGAAGTVVQDRTIYEDAEIFATTLHASGFISERDFATYMELYDAMQKALRPPDLLVYLRCSVRAIRRRIHLRGRPSEQSIPASYLRKMNQQYESWLEGYRLSPVLVWDSERADFITDLVDQLDFHQAIEPFLV